MNTSTWGFTVMGMVALVAFGNAAAEVKHPEEKTEFVKKLERAKSTLGNATLRDLEQALDAPALQSIDLEDILGDPEYFFYPNRLDTFCLNTLAGGKSLDGKDTSLSEETRLQCLCVIGATKALMTTNAHIVAKCLLVRKDQKAPSLLDGMIAYAAISADEQRVAPEQRGAWKDLLQSKNPVCRLVAVARARTWAEERDFPQIVSLALADSYCYTRECGLNYIRLLPRKEGAASVKRYLETARTAAPSEPAQHREDRLREIALRLFGELSKDVSTKPPR